MATRNPQPKTARAAVIAPEPEMNAGYGGEPTGDKDGSLAIGLAAMVVAIVGLTVVMIIMTAT